MAALGGEVTLSRFFNANVQLVAKMCPRCYEESVDVKIVSINLNFLDQVSDNLKNVDVQAFKALKERVMSLERKQEDFCGFSAEEAEKSASYHGAFEEVVEKFGGNCDANNNEGRSFSGFSSDEIRRSRLNLEKFLMCSRSVGYKIYNKVRWRHNKLRSKGKRRSWCDSEKASSYFEKDLKFDENKSKYFIKYSDRLPGEEEEVGVKIEKCEHIEAEHAVDYESMYFKLKPVKEEKDWFKSNVTIEEKKPFPWIPPRSPHNLIEEVLYRDPWALLVSTIFLNRTRCTCARPYVFWFLTENPDPFKVAGRNPSELEKYFVTLGLQRTRASQVWRMSQDYLGKNWKSVRELYGIGKYGEDAYRMFCEGDFSVAPRDRFLRIYKAWFEKIVMGQGREVVKEEGF